MNQDACPVTVFACESQPIVVEGLEKVFADRTDLQFAGSASNLSDALYCLAGRKPAVILVDQSLGLRPALQFIADARNVAAESQGVLWTTELSESDCFRALQTGARGIVGRRMPIGTLLECLRSVARGSVWIENSLSSHMAGFLNRRQTPRLTPREREIVRHVCQGLKNKQIGEALRITSGTVKVHLMHIFEKTGAKDRFELAIHGRGLVGLEAEAGVSEAPGRP